jgi:hypothetical protein
MKPIPPRRPPNVNWIRYSHALLSRLRRGQHILRHKRIRRKLRRQQKIRATRLAGRYAIVGLLLISDVRYGLIQMRSPKMTMTLRDRRPVTNTGVEIGKQLKNVISLSQNNL